MQKYVQSGKIKLYTEYTNGKSPCLVLVHGACANATFFKSLIEKLRRAGNSILTFDRRGNARSDKPMTPREYGLGIEVSDIDNILNFYNIREVIPVGHSAGSLLAIKYASARQDRVKGLAIISGSHNFAETYSLQLPDQKWAFSRIGRAFMLFSILNYKPFGIFLENKDLVDYSKIKLASPADGGNRARNFQKLGWANFAQLSLHDLRAAYYSYEHLFDEDLSKEASQITCPVLVMAGRHDEFVRDIEAVEKAFPNASRLETMLVEAGHSFILTHPEIFVKEFSEFFLPLQT